MPTLAEILGITQNGQAGGSPLADLIRQSAPPTQYYGYPVRQPYQGENSYFRTNPNVAGMAAEDGKITFNPYSQGVNRDAVGRNEAARLWMRENKFDPQFEVTPEQSTSFRGTPYESNPSAMRQTILGRLLSNDPSAGAPTLHQLQISDWLRETLKARK